MKRGEFLWRRKGEGENGRKDASQRREALRVEKRWKDEESTESPGPSAIAIIKGEIIMGGKAAEERHDDVGTRETVVLNQVTSDPPVEGQSSGE